MVEAAAAALLDGRNQYAPLTGLPELRQAVSAANARFYGLPIDPDAGVVVTSGATEALAACLAAMLNPGDEIVLIEPLYDTYLPVIRLLGAVPKLVRLEPPGPAGGGWTLPRDALAAAFSPRTRAILLNTPMNPPATSSPRTNSPPSPPWSPRMTRSPSATRSTSTWSSPGSATSP